MDNSCAGTRVAADTPGDIGGIHVIAGRDAVEVSMRRKVRDVAHVIPGFAAIHGVVDLAGAAHCPHHTGLGFGDGEVSDGRRGWRRSGDGSWPEAKSN